MATLKTVNAVKVGDHATSQISSIRYGGLKSGSYVIGEGLKYAYDKNGNIAEIRENGVLIAKYAYDKLNRIVREDNKKLNKSIFFTYDNNGNILSKREAAYSITAAVDGITSFTSEKLYGYDGTHGDRLVDFGGQAITYNGIGNPLNYRSNALIWEKGRQLKKFGSVEFMYDGYGKRTKKGNTVYTYDVGNKLVKQSDGTNTLEFIYDGSGLTGVKHGSINYIVRKNAQGDITALLDTSGNIVVKYVYDAWGNHVVTDNNGTVISSSTHIGNLNPFRYRSYLYDTETKLYYLQTRYYDPEVGRFINADGVSYLDPDSINGLNLYAYCGNNAVMRVDPTGNSWKDVLGWIGVAVVLVGLTALTICTFGAAAPITGVAAMMIVGATIGAFIGTAVSIGTQAYHNGWGNISGLQVFRDCVGGAVAGAISAIPTGGGFLGYLAAFGLGGTASVAGGLISGAVTDWKSALLAFGIGGAASVIAKGASDLLLKGKANAIFNQGRKAKSLAVQQLQGSPFNMGSAALKGGMRNAFKDTSLATIKVLVNNANPWFRLGIFSSLNSGLLSGLPYAFI